MIKCSYLLCILHLLLVLTSCGSQKDEADSMPYSQYVEAFTSGKVSRYSPVYLILNREIPAGRLKADQLNKQIHITPEVKGSFSLENGRTIAFKPAAGFERNTTYSVTVDFSRWFDTDGEDDAFAFRFTTYPLALRANLDAFDVSKQHENGYDLAYTLHTPDRENPETVESLVRFSETVAVAWQHSPDGKKHQARLQHVAAGAEAERSFALTVAPNKLQVPEEELLAITIPSMHDFSVYGVRYVSEPEKYIEVAFTKMLDNAQNLEGLAFLAGNRSATVNVDGNKLRLYPDAQRTGGLNVHLNRAIRSKSGLKLGQDVVRHLEVDRALPAVRFVGDGVIIPQSTQLTVPFQAIYLRGVVVSVVKIMEQNIGQFLQINQLNESFDLMRTGRLVVRKTIFLDEDASLDLSKWNTFSLDLNQLIQPEPGAIYRISLLFNKALSVYPCGDEVKKSKEQLLAEDALKFREEDARFDAGGYYYNDGEEINWWDYKYEERDNPCSNSYYVSKTATKNVLATNLGLMAMAGEAGELVALVHNITDTSPLKGVEVKAYNYQQQLLAAGVTDDKGRAQLNLSGGKPFYLIATSGKQRSYLRVDGGSALSLSSFDVAGEVVQKGIKGFIYGERGVWRPGDTLHLGFMLNDRLNKLPANHPVVMELYNPLGQLYLRKTQTRGKLGVCVFDMPTEPDAPTGAWNVQVNVGGAGFSKRLRIESIKPNRLKIGLTMREKVLLRGEPIDARLHTEWLQGATARNLKYAIEGTFISTPTTFEGYNAFCFDDPSRLFNSEESKLVSGTTDATGNATIEARFETGSTAPGMLMANLVTRVYEESGDFSIDGSRLLYSPYKRYAGIKSPQQDKEQLNTGTDYTYEVASLNYRGRPEQGTILDVSIYKVNWYWWWSSDRSDLARFVSESYNKPVKRFTVTTGANGKGSFHFSAENDAWGTYFISVKDPESKHATGVMSYYDWPSNEGRRNTDGSEAATMLRFKTDKDQYKPGEKLIVTIPSSKGSRAVVCVANGSRILSITEQACEAGQTVVQLEVTPEMQPNAYVYITLLQPHGITKNDLPIRLYGVVPFSVTSAESHLNPVILAPSEIKPESGYAITVSEQNGREMAYTLAVVDEGLLDLTRFRTPEPWNAFNGREALGISTWDLYNYVVGAYGGRIDGLFSIGGDDALNKGPKAIVNRFKPVVQFEGPFLLKKGEKKKHTYRMANYNGRVKVMVVAGDGQAYGHADQTVMVRKPVMLLGTLPRVIGVGEEMVVPAAVFATEDGVGDVQVSIACSGNMQVVGETSRVLHFDRKDDKQALFRIRVKEKPGMGRVTITATGKGEKSVYETDLEIRSVLRSQTNVIPQTLQAGGVWKETVRMPGMEGTNSLMLEVSDIPPVDLTSRLAYLSAYPHGCVEQLLSKAFPQLYLNEFTSLSKEKALAVEKQIKETLSRLRSYQTVDGAFSYWPGGTGSHAWATVYAVHFMLSAEAKGYLVPDVAKRSALSHLLRVSREWKEVDSPSLSSEELTQAYRLFVLALAQQPEMGAMNRLKENHSLSDRSRWLLAAAYTLVGRTDVAHALATKTTNLKSAYSGYDGTFGSDLRDESVCLLTLCLLDKGKEAATLAAGISKSLSSGEWLSTQSTAFSLVALSEYMARYPVAGTMDFTYTSGGKTEKVGTEKPVWSATLLTNASPSASLEVRNTGKSTLFVRVITQGIPAQDQVAAYQNGVTMAVSYVNAAGSPVDVSNLPQGTSFSSIVTVKNPTAEGLKNLVLTELFPAGWEILNSRFVHEGAASGQTTGVSYQDIRDDRVCSYIDDLPAGRQVTVKINLCAVYPGRFYLPPVYCEAMYDNLVRANTGGREVSVQ